jgi:hypothetical protein
MRAHAEVKLKLSHVTKRDHSSERVHVNITAPHRGTEIVHDARLSLLCCSVRCYWELAIMFAETIVPQKRVLSDSTNRNLPASPPDSAKKRKFDSALRAAVLRSSQNGPKSKFGSSQPKSQFESEVLEKLTQDISGLKQINSEKDQQWDRPSLDFDAKRDDLCFQQIEAEEGTLHGGTTIQLFGVTEVRVLALAPTRN